MVDELAVRRRARRSSSACYLFYVVFAGEHQLTRPLTLGIEGGKEALAVFSHQEEAQTFLQSFEPAGEGWRVKEASVGEIILLLYDPSCDAHAVALDPLPQILNDGLLALVTLERRRFVRWSASRECSRTLPGGWVER
jgi:hypothetical protein